MATQKKMGGGGGGGGGRSNCTTTTSSSSRSRSKGLGTSRSNARLPSRWFVASSDLRRGFITYAAMTMVLLHASFMAGCASQLVAAATSTKIAEGGVLVEVEDGSNSVVGADHPPSIGNKDKDVTLPKILKSDGDTAKGKTSITTLTGFGNAVGPGLVPDSDELVKDTDTGAGTDRAMSTSSVLTSTSASVPRKAASKAEVGVEVGGLDRPRRLRIIPSMHPFRPSQVGSTCTRT